MFDNYFLYFNIKFQFSISQTISEHVLQLYVGTTLTPEKDKPETIYIHRDTNCLKKEKDGSAIILWRFGWKNYSRTGVRAARTSPSASSTVGEDVVVFCLEGRRWPGTIMPAATSKAPPEIFIT